MAFRDLIWKPRCDKVKKWEKDNNITLKEIKNRPSSDKYIKYSQTLTHDIDGCTYDHKNRRILSAKDQWELALSKARKHVNSFVRIGHVNLFKVSGRVKGIMKFFGE